MKRLRFLIRNLFIIICLCIPFAVIVFTNAVISLVKNVHSYVQSEWKKFNDIYGHSTPVPAEQARQDTDPALTTHEKVEDHVHGACCSQKTSENGQRHHFKEIASQQMNNTAQNCNGQRNSSTSKQRKVRRLIIIQPPSSEQLSLKNANALSGKESVAPVCAHVPRQMSSGINAKRTVFSTSTVKALNTSNLYLLIRRAVNTVVNVLFLVTRKIYSYLRGVLNVHGDSKANVPHTEPAFIAHLKGEEGAPFKGNPHVKVSETGSRNLKNVSEHSEIVENRNQSQGQNRKVQEGTSLMRLAKGLYCRIKNVIFALNFQSFHLTFRPRVSAEKQVKTSEDIRHSFCNDSNEQNEDKASGFDCSHQAKKLHETLATHSRSVQTSPARAVTSEQGRSFKCFNVLPTAWNSHAPPNNRMDTGPKLFSSPQQSGVGNEQWNASPTVGKPAETQTKLPTKDKAHREVMPLSSLASKADSAATTPAEEKPKGKKMPQRTISSARVDVSAPTQSSTGMDTGPKLFSCLQHSEVGKKQWNASPTVRKRAETEVELHTKGKAHGKVRPPSPSASKVGSAARAPLLKRTISTSNVNVTAPTPPAEGKEKRKAMPCSIQPADEHVPAHVKAEEQEEKPPILAHSNRVWSANVCSDSGVLESQTIRKLPLKKLIDVEPTVSRAKRAMSEEESEEDSWDVQGTIGRKENPPSERRNTKRKVSRNTCTGSKSSPTRQRHRVHVQKPEKVTAAEPELMEVVESPPETPFIGPPDPMELGGEQHEVVFPFGEPSVSGGLVEEIEPMEIDQEPCESEPMETNQVSFLDELSFAWENIMESFLYQSVERMETDEESTPTTPCVAQLEAIMETMREPVIAPMPFGQFENFQWRVGTGVKTSEATFTVPQDETMETIQETAKPFGQFANFQWPLGTGMKTQEGTFTVPQEKTLETNQGLVDACKPFETTFRFLASTVNVSKEETVSTQTPAAEQAVMQPMMKPATPPPLPKRTKPPPLVKTEAPPSTQPTNQLTLEQLQIVPKVPYIPDGLDSDSDDEDSDDEPELGEQDLEILDKLLEILREKELSSEQCHM